MEHDRGDDILQLAKQFGEMEVSNVTECRRSDAPCTPTACSKIQRRRSELDAHT